MNLSFTKMHGLGNDFVVLDQREQPVRLNNQQIRMIADRRNGVGFDQMLWVERSSNPAADFALRIFNADGGKAEQCGNGVRCVARYLERKRLIKNEKFFIDSGGTLVGIKLESDGSVSCDMGTPVFEPARIPFRVERRSTHYNITVGDEAVSLGVVSMGNPHAVLDVDDVNSAPVERLGSAIEHHPDFPERANIGFMQITDRDQIRLRVHERGVGETRACGTGACAAAVVARSRGLVEERVTVSLTGGRLEIFWGGESSPVWMRGPATWVFEGNIDV